MRRYKRGFVKLDENTISECNLYKDHMDYAVIPFEGYWEYIVFNKEKGYWELSKEGEQVGKKETRS